MRRSKETRNLAWELLRKHYWNIFVVAILATLILAIPFAFLFLTGPIMFGVVLIILRALREDKSDDFSKMFEGFNHFERLFITQIWVFIKVFLWSLLFIIPGIIRAYSLSQTSYIAYDYPELTPKEILKKSTEMMKGNRFRLFKLQFSFIGWMLLALFTFGIGFFFLIPYIYTAQTFFYEELKEKYSPTS